MRRAALIALLLTPVLVLLVAYLAPSDWLGPPALGQPPPRVFLHRAGAALWPQNSLTAVRGAIAHRDADGRPVQGIEVDIALTRDGVPVLSHDPWIHETLCRRADGRRVEQRILIHDLTWSELRLGYICGGEPDPDFPAARPVPEPIARLDDVLAALAAAPEIALYLDVKVDPPLTAPAADFAAAIFTRWREAGLDNPLYVEGPKPAAVAAWRAAAGELPATFVVSYPAFTAQNNWLLTALTHRARVRLSPEDAARTDADGLVSLPEVLSWQAARHAREAGKEVVLFFRDADVDLDRYCAWPASVLIVDAPDAGRCPDAAEHLARGDR